MSAGVPSRVVTAAKRQRIPSAIAPEGDSAVPLKPVRCKRTPAPHAPGNYAAASGPAREARRARAQRARSPSGVRTDLAFTLIEVLLVALLTAIVLTAAVNMYLQLTRAGAAAMSSTGESRRAANVLDRIAREIEGAVLVKKPDATDPLQHPWLFLAEGGSAGAGAERFKFDSRALRPRAPRESDLAVIAYWLAPQEGDGFALLRWTSPQLPEQLDREFPRSDDPRVNVLAKDVAAFGVRLLGEEGEWTDAWDSSTLQRSSQLPLAAEIQLALLPEDPAQEPSAAYVRRVRIPLRPLDLEKALGGEAGDPTDEEEDEDNTDCTTVSECLAANPGALEGFLATHPDPGSVQSVIDSIQGQCWTEAAGLGIPVSGCE